MANCGGKSSGVRVYGEKTRGVMRMKRECADLVVIGGGPAGMAAALAAKQHGVAGIVILERDRELGGILQQCIHNGFGLHYFAEELTGPEYAERFIRQVEEAGIAVKTNTMVLEVTPEKAVYAVNSADGMVCYQAKAVVLAMGCRERTREAIGIPGTRPAGIFTAGTAQRYLNMEGYLPGKRVLILGSGDIGLIMARRLTLEGAEVLGVLEIMPYSNGLRRNVVQCLDDYGIPLLLQHTVVEIHGRERITGVTTAQVDGRLVPVPGTERFWEVDTLLLSVGLIPENELTQGAKIEMDEITGGALVDQNRETVIPGVFACGNVLHVHDLVDYVTEEAQVAGKSAAGYIARECGAKKGMAGECGESGAEKGKAGECGESGAEKGKAGECGEPGAETWDMGDCGNRGSNLWLAVERGTGVRYVVPQRISLALDGGIEFFLRVAEPMEKGTIVVRNGDTIIWQQRERFLRPAEMIRIRTEMQSLGIANQRGRAGVLTVSVEEGA